jgi:hypothetical protein
MEHSGIKKHSKEAPFFVSFFGEAKKENEEFLSSLPYD